MNTSISRRARSLLLTATVTGSLALTPAVASATPTTTAKEAADFLVTQLQGSTPNHFVTSYDAGGGTVGTYDDPGSTLDGYFAFRAATGPTSGTYTTQATRTINWVRDNLNSYVGGGTTNSTTCATTGTLYAGALGKYTLAVLAAGRNPTTPSVTGGRNLILDLRCRENASGRFVDTPTDYSVTFSQALAILALKRYGTAYTNPNGSTLTTAVNYLKSQQCTSGAFPSNEGGGASGCTSSNPADPDSTAVAVAALYATGETTAANNALAWLNTVKETPASGQTAWRASLPCQGASSPQLSVNSTALAITANKRPSTPVTAIGPAQDWLVSQARSNGALKGCGSSLTAVQNSLDVRASTQGILGLLAVQFPGA